MNKLFDWMEDRPVIVMIALFAVMLTALVIVYAASPVTRYVLGQCETTGFTSRGDVLFACPKAEK